MEEGVSSSDSLEALLSNVGKNVNHVKLSMPPSHLNQGGDISQPVKEVTC